VSPRRFDLLTRPMGRGSVGNSLRHRTRKSDELYSPYTRSCRYFQPGIGSGLAHYRLVRECQIEVTMVPALMRSPALAAGMGIPVRGAGWRSGVGGERGAC
jgi:hypothetical protein